jgi:RHS repeat-associated protein
LDDDRQRTPGAVPQPGPRSDATPRDSETSPRAVDDLPAVSLPAITMPKGGGAIRSIGETFKANAVTGTGSMSVPLPLSPSRPGNAPQLSLAYDSGQGQGVFGLGWDVAVPSISRRTDKGLPQYRDAEESDEFVLSGAEVLVPGLVQGTGGGWTPYSFDDGTYMVTRYRPRVESAFARIEKRVDKTTGDVHWRTTTKDNVTSLFGRSAAARLADPKKPWRIFRWLLEATFDDRGNVTWFEYKPEDTANVAVDRSEEKTRLADPQSFANLHPKRIHYGSRTPLATSDPTASDLAALAWLFEVVFDYGEHDPHAPTTDEVATWPCRADPFSSFRATFDVRAYRLCQRILFFHRFDELGRQAQIIRSLDLAYDASPISTQLASVTLTGWMPATGGGWTTAAMPRMDFGYTPSDLHTDIQALDPEGESHLPGGVDGGRYRWIDLDGEGIPGVLSQQAGALFYSRNEGGGELAVGRALRSQPNIAALGDAGQMLASLDGDGQLDLVLLGSTGRGFFERVEKGWAPFRRFPQAPNFDPADPNLRWLDIDGDGLADAVLAQDEVFVWSKSLGDDGFERPRITKKPNDENVGPNFVFADATESIFLADMTGDGMVDLVRVRNGEVCYWPNLGYGRFGAKITMGAAPAFDHPDAFDPKRLRFGDIDGSGASDIAYIRSDGVVLYLNQAGNRWSDATVVAGLPGGVTTTGLVDLLGTGTACLVWSSPDPVDAQRPVRYVDLLASSKPRLLSSVVNNLGLETAVRYASSTSFYLADRRTGTPWVTRLPFPVQVVARVETVDHVQSTRLVTTFSYRHGYFDGPEREFRGFGLIEQWDGESYSSAHGAGIFPPGMNEQTGEFVLPPVHTKSWFDTGAWREARDLYARYQNEWYAGDAQAPPLAAPVWPEEASADEAREAARARKGLLLRQEVYADDGTAQAGDPYVVTEHRYGVRLLQPMLGQRHPVFYPHERETVGRHYERNPNDPRVEQTFTLEIDGFGNVLRSARVALPRRNPLEPEQGILLATCTDATFVNETSAFHRLGVPIESHGYELTGLPTPAGLLAFHDVDGASKTGSVLPYEATPTPGTLQKRIVAHRRSLYLKDDLSAALPLGNIESKALVFETYAKTLTANLVTNVFGARVTPTMLSNEAGYVNLDGDWWRPSGRPTYDPSAFYSPTALTDPFGNTTRVVMDGYALLPVEMHTSQTAAFDNATSSSNDYRVLRPVLVTDPNGNQTAYAFDALGTLVATAVMGKPSSGQGDTLADPTTRFEYDLLAWQTSQQPASTHTFAREKHGAANPRWQETYGYSDGSGQEVLRKVQAEPDPQTGQPRWVGTGRTVFDNKGNPVKKYEPYFASTPNYEDEPSIVMQGVTAVLRYDALARLVQTDFPDGTFATVTFDPWSVTHADANDNVLESPWYAQSSSPSATPQQQRAASLAAKHAHTPTVQTGDSLGRAFLAVEDNGALGKYPTRSARDIQGNVTSVTDARSNVVLRHAFDMEGGVLHWASADAGDRYQLRDVDRHVLRSWDGRGFATRTSCDPLRRPTHVYVQPPTGPEILAERLVYGEAVAGGGAVDNLRGKRTLHYDGAGELHLSQFDFQGNLTTSTRKLATTYQQIPDWSTLALLTDPAALQAQAASLLETEAFTTTSAFDALDRLVSTTTPDASTILPTYNEANLLERLDARVRGAQATTSFVTNFDYNARGQRIRADYANGTSTTYAYEALTFLLARQTTVRARDNGRIQDFTLTYDPVRNVVELDDNSDWSLFFSGTQPVAGGGQYEYEAVYRLAKAQGREHPGQQMPDQNDSPLASLPHPNDTQALRAYVEQYTYDPVGNILQVLHQAGGGGWTRQYQYAPNSDRLQRTSMPGDPPQGPFSGQYDHDLDGNMTRMPHLASIAWDHANRMLSADLGGGGTAYYAYDAAGTRVRKIVQRIGTLVEERIYLGGYEVYRQRTGTTLDGERQTLHLMDDERRVAMVETETVASGTSVNSPTSRIRYQLANQIESACVEADEQGALITYEEYFSFGATSFHSAAGGLEVSAKRYRYNGRERDDETGLNYNVARYYVPWLGRWTSPDPAGIVEGTNLYRYARDNPTGRADPDGTYSGPLPLTPQQITAIEQTLAQADAVVGAGAGGPVATGGVATGELTVGGGGAALGGAIGAALVYSAAVLGSTYLTVKINMQRSAGIVMFGNPLAQPAMGAAFPVTRVLQEMRDAADLEDLANVSLPRAYEMPQPEMQKEGQPPILGRIYVTYHKYNTRTHLWYSGRTSAVIDLTKSWALQAEAAVRARDANHHVDEKYEPSDSAFLPAEVDRYWAGRAVDYTQRYRDVAYLAIRGREQQLIDYHGHQTANTLGQRSFNGGARSDSPDPPLTENAVRGVGKDNPLGEIFHIASSILFGQLHQYTGFNIFRR